MKLPLSIEFQTSHRYQQCTRYYSLFMGQEDLEHHLIRSMSKICMPKELSTFDVHHMMTQSGILILRDVVYRKICDALRDLVPFVEFKKREKHPSKSVTFSKVAGLQHANLLKVTLLHGCTKMIPNRATHYYEYQKRICHCFGEVLQ